MGSAVVEFLSVLFWKVWKTDPGMACTLRQVFEVRSMAPATTAFSLSVLLKERTDAYATPSGPIDCHGSELRWYLCSGSVTDVVHTVLGNTDCGCQAPPVATAKPTPCPPPFDHRSWCQVPIIFWLAP